MKMVVCFAWDRVYSTPGLPFKRQKMGFGGVSGMWPLPRGVVLGLYERGKTGF